MKTKEKTAKMRDSFKGKKLYLFRWGKRIVVTAAVVFLLLRYVAGFALVDGRSMMNTLEHGDLVAYTRIVSQLKRGDIVSVARPEGSFFVKRVIALGGDEVDLRDGVIYVNGVAETGDYVLGETLPEEAEFTYPYLVEEGDAFIIGDNRGESLDSRSFGAVNVRHQITGKLLLMYSSRTGLRTLP